MVCVRDRGTRHLAALSMARNQPWWPVYWETTKQGRIMGCALMLSTGTDVVVLPTSTIEQMWFMRYGGAFLCQWVVSYHHSMWDRQCFLPLWRTTSLAIIYVGYTEMAQAALVGRVQLAGSECGHVRLVVHCHH